MDGGSVTYTTETIKGRDYALFTVSATSAQVVASYGQDTNPPVLSNIRAENLSDVSANIAWTTDEPATSLVDYGLSADNLIFQRPPELSSQLTACS